MSDEKLSRARILQQARSMVLEIQRLKGVISAIREGLRQDMPEVMGALEEAEEELPKLQEDAKPILRRLGAGEHAIAGHVVGVRSASTKVECDIAGLVERAHDRGEIDDLIEAGVLRYEVVPHQIARLPAKQRAIYGSYLREVPGTAAVVLPPELK